MEAYLMIYSVCPACSSKLKSQLHLQFECLIVIVARVEIVVHKLFKRTNWCYCNIVSSSSFPFGVMLHAWRHMTVHHSAQCAVHTDIGLQPSDS